MAGWLAEQRQARILELLRAQDAVKIGDLATELSVSDMTVRRDLDHLANLGLARKVHGGATAPTHTALEPGFSTNTEAHREAKRAIAQAAAALVLPNQAVAISGGTTTYQVAVELGRRAQRDHLTLVTNSLPAAEALAAAGAGPQTILTGGVRTPSQALVGPVAQATLAALRVDWLFLGVHGMDPQVGFTTPNLAEAATNQALAQSAAATVVTADSSKWGVQALAQIVPLDQAQHLITDTSLPDRAAAQARRHLAQLTLVEPETVNLPRS